MKSIETTLAQRVRTLQGNPYFNDLSERLLGEIAEHTQLREYQRGDVLFWEADQIGRAHV